MKKVFMIILVLLAMLVFVACGNKKTEEKINQSNSTSNEGITKADENIEVESNLLIALQAKFNELYGNKITETRYYIDKIYTKEEEKGIPALSVKNLGPDEYAFEISFDIKPDYGADTNEMLVPNGEFDGLTGWIVNCKRVGTLRLNPNPEEANKYVIEDFGTSF